MIVPTGPVDVRVTVLDRTAANVQILDAVTNGDFAQGVVKYEDTPNGCGAAELTMALVWEKAVARGYWTAMNIVEISTGDDALQQAFTTNLAPNSDNLNGWVVSGSGAFATGGPGGAADYEYTGTGSASGFNFPYSPTVSVTPLTQNYVYSADVDTRNVTAGNATLLVMDTTRSTAYKSFTIPNGKLGRVDTGTFTLPAGVTQVELLFDTNNCTVANGQKLVMSQPMLEAASSASAWYVPSGANRLYVGSKKAYDPTQGEDTQQVYLYDGLTLTMRMQVLGVGTDARSAQDYITVGNPLSGGGNPTTITNYGAGTVLGRRRYAGYILRRQKASAKTPHFVINCGGTSRRLDARMGTFTITSIDVGTAIYDCLSQFTAGWPELTISAGNFPTLGTLYTGSKQDTTVSRMIADILTAVTNGDVWAVRVGHDRTPRLIKLYTMSSNTYAYPVTLNEGDPYYEAAHLTAVDQDASNLANSIKVIGDTDPTTKQPFAAIGQDANSITTYGQWDATPVTNTAAKSNTIAQTFATSLLNQKSLATSQGTVKVYTRYDTSKAVNPSTGLSRGDAVRGITGLTIGGIDMGGGSTRNLIPDSELQYGPGQVSALWTGSDGTVSTGVAAGAGGSNALLIAGSGAASNAYGYSKPFNVAPGQVGMVSTTMDASNVTAGQPKITIYSWVNGSLGAAVGTGALQTAGLNSRISAQISIPSNATYTQCVAVIHANGATITNAQNLKASQPQFEPGSVLGNYSANYATPPFYGLVMSALTTITAKGESLQDIGFAAIEPDWNADVAERANALASALVANTATHDGTLSYIVSSSAFPPTYSSSSLSVTIPQYYALFASGTSTTSIAQTNLTLTASATNWVWINPNGTYTIKQDPSSVGGAILYGYFTAGASGVDGFTKRASTGLTGAPNAIDAAGQGLQSDFQGMVEAAINNAYAGYWIQNATYTQTYWEKSGASLSTANGPIIFQVTGRNSTTGGELAIMFLADTNTANTDASNCYMAHVYGTSLEIWKRSAGTWTRIAGPITVVDPGSGGDHTLTVAVTPLGGGISIAAQFDSSAWAVTVEPTPVRTSGYYGMRNSATTATLYNCVRSFNLAQSQAALDATIGKDVKKNLVLNGNNWFGTGKVAPGGYGWTGNYLSGSCASGGSYAVNGFTYTPVQVTGSGNSGEYQDIPVVPGQTYTYCALVYSEATAQAKLWIGDTNVSTQFNAAPGTPLGSLGPYYGGAAATTNGNSDTPGGAAWRVLYGTFTVPNGNNNARLLFQNIGTGGHIYFLGVMVIPGNRLQDYADQEPNPAYLSSSSPLNGQGSIPPVAIGGVSASGSYPSGQTPTITIAWSAQTYNLPDSTVVNISAGSQSFSGKATSTTYHYGVYADLTGAIHILGDYGANTAPNQTQKFAVYLDGRIPISEDCYATTPASTGGTGGGGGGGGGSCPAVWQLVETKEQGKIRADELIVGMHIPGPGGWVRITELIKVPAPIWRYTLSNGSIEESFDVNDTHALLDESGEWMKVRDLVVGQQLRGRDALLTVTEATYLCDDFYISMEVEGHIYYMGDALVHNPITL